MHKFLHPLLRQTKHPLSIGLSITVLAAAGCSLARSDRTAKQSENQSQQNLVTQATPAEPPKELSSSDAARVCRATAEQMASHGKEPEAIEQYERSRSFDARQKGVARRLAVLYDRQGNTEKATAEYTIALKESPRDADLWNDYGYFHYARTRYDQAETALRKGLKFDTKHKRAWMNLGLVLGEQGRYDEAQQAFQHAVSPAAAKNNVAVILARNGEVDRARTLFQQASVEDPSLEPPRPLLAHLDRKPAGKVQQASFETETDR
jgi:Tfp pilus assembly protein PilF